MNYTRRSIVCVWIVFVLVLCAADVKPLGQWEEDELFQDYAKDYR